VAPPGSWPREPDDRLWLFGIARRVLANAHRAERRRARLRLRLSAGPPPAPVPPASAGSEAARIARALAEVPASDRRPAKAVELPERLPPELTAR
jgi:RNA polymerase sigma-70 factor, ECF subfamily